MLIAYLAIGVLTGLVFSTLTIVVGHAFPFAVIAYVLTGMGAVCLAAYRAAQLPENQ